MNTRSKTINMDGISTTNNNNNNPTISLLDCLKERSLHFSEFIKNRLYFATVSEVNLNFFLKKSDSTYCFIHFDKELLYQPFNHDFGPLNLAMLCRYCKKMNSVMQRNKTIIHLTTTNRFKRANAAYLIGSYCIIYHHLQPNDVISSLKELSISYVAYKTFTPFVDAGFDMSENFLNLEDCFNAIYKALKQKILNFDKFNLNEYLFYEKVENGDLNWIIPEKFIAFCDPQTYSDSSNHYVKLYINYFRKNNITTIIRLNKSRYDPKVFTDKGFKHYNLIFMDGGVPSDHILAEFLRITETSPGGIAVHCKAGLGRTGTMIACYLMKHMKFTALEAIAWVRICRPGSIVGHQQKWLELKQNFLWNQLDSSIFVPPNDDDVVVDTDGSNNNNNNNCSSSNENNNDINNINGNPLQPITIVKCQILRRDGSIPSVTVYYPKSTPTMTTKKKESTKKKANAKNYNNRIDNAIDNNNQSTNCVTPSLPLTLTTITQQQQQIISMNETNNDNNNDDSESNNKEFTQGDYLNQIKFNRKRQLKYKINHWFKSNQPQHAQQHCNNKNSTATNHNNNNNNLEHHILDANNNACDEEMWSNGRNSAASVGSGVGGGDVSELKPCGKKMFALET